MERIIFFFAKIFEEKEHAEAMLNGELYINPLSYFQQIEETTEGNRPDKHEAVISWLQPEKITLKINNHEIKSEDLSSPVSVQLHSHSNINVFCMYAAHNGDFTHINKESFPEYKKQIELPKECLTLGNHSVTIVNTKEFIERIRRAVKSNGYGMRAKLVNYYDPTKFHGHFTNEEAIFNKRIVYQHQREYRIAIDSCSEEQNPLLLKIGNIQDIALYCETSKINKGLTIKIQ